MHWCEHLSYSSKYPHLRYPQAWVKMETYFNQYALCNVKWIAYDQTQPRIILYNSSQKILGIKSSMLLFSVPAGNRINQVIQIVVGGRGGGNRRKKRQALTENDE